MARDRQQGTAGGHGSVLARPAGAPQDFAPGTHLVTLRRGYAHHGIYVGGGHVVHYGGLSRSWRRGPVEEVSLERFAAGRSVLIKPTADARYSNFEIVDRARSRIGEDRYRIASNNCEHFCEWCINGEPRSEQVESLIATPLLSFLRRFRPFARRLAPVSTDESVGSCAA
jgi:hypothetical protein